MEKIEKLEEFNWVSGRDAVTIALCNTIIRKQNEIIDHLNSQDQEEENTVCEGCGKTITSRFMQSYTKGDGMHSYCLSCDPEKQDTPEEEDVQEWEEEWHSTPVYNQISFIKNLLKEREREAREEGFIKGVKECTEKLSKLTTK